MIKLLHGDCLELMKDIPDGSVDMVLTDLPYGTVSCKWDCVIPFDLMWKQLNRVIKKNSVICLFGSEPFSSNLRCSNLKMYKYDWIWDKRKPGNFCIAKFQPLRRTENISVFYIKSTYAPIMVKRDSIKKSKIYSRTEIFAHEIKKDNNLRVYTHKYPTNLIEISNAIQRNKLHPTQKPVELLEYLIKTYTNENQTVLDFTMGSGSTGIACLNTNRKFIGIEKDDHYFNVAKKRIDEHQLSMQLEVK